MKNISWILGVAIFFSRLAGATPLTLPQPMGPYGVGTKNIEFKDPTRTQLRSNETRRWMGTVYYPTAKSDHTSPYMPGTVLGGNVLGYAIPNAQVIQNQKFPVVLFFPGRGGERQGYSILCEALASHGYMVMAMDHPYGANFVKFPDGTKIVLTLKDLLFVPRDRDYRYRYDDELIEAALKDTDFVLDHFQVFGDLSRACDQQNIILMGHSLGGNIAHIKGFADKRIKAIVDIDSKITERAIYGHVGVPPNPDGKPVLFIRGALQYQEDVGHQLTKIKNSTLWAPQVQHSAFSDKAYFSAKIPNFGMGFWSAMYNWFFKIGPYFSNTDTNLGDYNVDDWFALYPQYIVKWLDKRISPTNRTNAEVK